MASVFNIALLSHIGTLTCLSGFLKKSLCKNDTLAWFVFFLFGFHVLFCSDTLAQFSVVDVLGKPLVYILSVSYILSDQ